MMDVSYVENDQFRVVEDRTIGCNGRKLRLRTYRLKESPETGVSDISYTVIYHYALAGAPRDAVYHLGEFYRVTVL